MIRFIPDNVRIPWMRWRWPTIVVSIVLMVLSVLLVLVNGLNYGIDFTGGTLVEVRTEGPADLAEMRTTLNELGIGDVALQEFGQPSDVLIRVPRQEGGEEAQNAAVGQVRTALDEAFGQIEYRRVEVVGPKVGDELLMDGVYAVLFTLLAVLVYIWFRFEWQFGLGAVASLIHDVLLMLGLFSITGIQFDLASLAAILTTIGYSLNDNVVIFDRVRENMRRFKKMKLIDLIDLSINQTLARTTITALTTILALGSLYLLGPEVISGFTLAMLWGVVIGCYSTVFIASAIVLFLNVRPEQVAGTASPPVRKAGATS